MLRLGDITGFDDAEVIDLDDIDENTEREEKETCGNDNIVWFGSNRHLI